MTKKKENSVSTFKNVFILSLMSLCRLFIKNQITICLVLLLVLGLFLRVHNISYRYFNLLGFDEARDILVAKHQIQNGEWLSRGPAAFGGLGTLTNSAGYYHFLSLVWLLAGSVENFYLIWLVMMSSLIIISFQVGKQFFSSRTGLILALLVSISPEFVFESKNYYQPYLLPLCVFLFLYFLGKKSNKILNHTLAVFFLLLPLHFHYGILLLIPAATIWFIWERWQIKPDKDILSWIRWSIPLLVYVGLLLIWLVTTYTEQPFDQFQFVKTTVMGTTTSNIWAKLVELNLEFGRSLWKVGSKILSFVSISALLPIGYYYLKQKSTKASVQKSRVIFLFIALCSVFFMIFSKAQIYEIYLLALLPIYFLLLAESLNQLFKANKNFSFIILVFICMFSFSIYNIEEKNVIEEDTSIYSELEVISSKINFNLSLTSKSSYLNPDSFTLALLAPESTYFYDGWGTTGLWYFFEEILEKKLVVTTNNQYSANIEPIERNPDIVYFICDHRYASSVAESDQCLQKFTQNREYLKPNPLLLHQSTKYTVWRFEVNKNVGKFLYKEY